MLHLYTYNTMNFIRFRHCHNECNAMQNNIDLNLSDETASSLQFSFRNISKIAFSRLQKIILYKRTIQIIDDLFIINVLYFTQ